MNAIASVDFETSQALFLDTYSANRTTGSLILIDPVTNATVGAVMIREMLAGDRDDERRHRQRLTGKVRGRVTPEERTTRYGHLPAIFSLAGEREAAEGFERALLEQGFEAALVSNHEVTAPAKRALYGTLLNLGLVVVSWQETPIGARERNLMNQIAGKYHFELSGVQPVHAGESEVARGLRIAEDLRLASDPAKDRED
jgi:hypothetical protein